MNKLLEYYEEGIISKNELFSLAVNKIADQNINEIVASLPVKMQNDFKLYLKDLNDNKNSLIFICSSCSAPSINTDFSLKEEKVIFSKIKVYIESIK